MKQPPATSESKAGAHLDPISWIQLQLFRILVRRKKTDIVILNSACFISLTATSILLVRRGAGLVHAYIVDLQMGVKFPQFGGG